MNKADVDVMTILDPSYHSRGARNVLDAVRRALSESYTTSTVSRNGQAITIRFTDFRVDIVPGFRRKGGGYLICDSVENTFFSTDPKVHEQESQRANRAHNEELVPLIKMIKAWNRGIDKHFRSFHLEVLAWQIFDGVAISSYSWALWYFFAKMKPTIRQIVNDPAGYGKDVASYLDNETKFVGAESRVQTAWGRAQRAHEASQKGDMATAIQQWRLLFGDYFPAS